jgi:hypothetical protein
MRPLQELPERDVRFWRWRLRSPVCPVADTLAAAAGAAVSATVAVDCAVTWPANRVLLSDHDLSRLAGALIPACWAWLFLVPAALVLRRTAFLPARRAWRKPGRPSWSMTAQPLLPSLLRSRVRAGLAVSAVAGLAVIVMSFAMGAAKGSVQVLPGPVYRVSTLDLNNAGWTRVSAAQFSLWQARFVREDSLFIFFGLLTTSVAVSMLALRRQPARVGA